MSISSIIAVFDMGFSSQFGRNITYVFSGAQKLQKEGVSMEYNDTINEKLLATTLVTAKIIYRYLAWLALIPLLSLGSWYVYNVSNGFTSIDNALPVWVIFSISCFFNLYYKYLNSFLQGRGMVKETKKGQVYSKIVQIVITFAMLFSGCSLLSVVVANLIAPFVFRFYTYTKFHDSYIKKILHENNVDPDDINETFKILFYNAKKMGIIGILSTALGYASTLIIGSFLPLAEIGSYGLMVQLVGYISTVSTVFFYSITPELGTLMVWKRFVELRNKFGLSMAVFFLIQFAGITVLLLCPILFNFLSFNTQLPSYLILVLYSLYKFFEQIQGTYSHLLLTENDLIFYPSAVWTGVLGLVSLIIVLSFDMGLLGVVLSQCIPLYLYSAWKWPIYATRKYGISFKENLVKYPITQFKNVWKTYLKRSMI